MIALWAVACGAPELAPAPALAPEARATLSARAVEAGQNAELTLQVRAPADWVWSVQPPEVQGLMVAPLEASALGPRWALGGEAGSYVIPPMTVRFTSPEGEVVERQTSPLYLDLGVQGPSSALEDLALAPVEEEGGPWGWVAAGAVGVLLLAGGIALARRQRWQAAQAPRPPQPPEEEALRDWAAARARGDLDDHALAMELSRLFRRYLERVTGLPALTSTSRELLASLEARPGFGPALYAPTERLLGATDRVKFARDGGGPALFDALDQDLRVVLAHLRAPERAGVPEGRGDV